MLKFVGDAICLSGSAGSKLKCDVLGQYYPLWWGITSGGPSNYHRNPTAIIELNAATGEVYIEDSKETTLGSAGHALELKIGSLDTWNLKLVLVEEDSECNTHLKNVIRRRWTKTQIDEIDGPFSTNSSNIFLLDKPLDLALDAIDELKLGNSIFFFDPLRNVEYDTIEKVANNRIKNYYKTGTEFFIFLFTSDWFLGRNGFTPLPSSLKKETWTENEKTTVSDCDSLFGNSEWQNHLLNDNPVEEKQRTIVELYANQLHKWFRYVLPLPFNPKENQIFHLILCSNFEVGVRITKDHYSSITGNPIYKPDRTSALKKFRELHPETFDNLRPRKRVPLEWRILWSILRQHEGGICDCKCRDLIQIESNIHDIEKALEWLNNKGYLKKADFRNAWEESITQYMLDWKVLKKNLQIESPPPLKPISPDQLANIKD